VPARKPLIFKNIISKFSVRVPLILISIAEMK